MHSTIEQKPAESVGSTVGQFVERRERRGDDGQGGEGGAGHGTTYNGPERRQFKDSHNSLRPEVKELAEAVDHYKMIHRRRFITYEELFGVIESLGYRK
jgi:hypothetical protein